MARERDWSRLASGTQRRWVSAFGGSRQLPPASRAQRAARAYQSGAHLPKERTGHEPPPVTTWSAVTTTEGVRPVTATTRREASRLGQYSEDVQRLLAGDLDPRDFKRRWSRRVRRAGGVELESDPAKVLAAMAAAGPAPEPYYRRHRRPAA